MEERLQLSCKVKENVLAQENVLALLAMPWGNVLWKQIRDIPNVPAPSLELGLLSQQD